MLKLEKISRHDLAIIFRSKERLLTPTFTAALAIAIVFHLLFVLLFTVTAFPIPWNTTVFPPSQVEAQPLFKTGATIAQWTSSSAENRLPPLAKPTQPALSTTPHFLQTHPVEYTTKISTHNPFLAIEQRVYQPSFSVLSYRKSPPVQLIISGPLAQRRLLADGISDSLQTTLSRLGNQEIHSRVVFNVLVDNHSGKILWYEAQELSSSATLNRLSETVLKKMRFAGNGEASDVAGVIELHFQFTKELPK